MQIKIINIFINNNYEKLIKKMCVEYWKEFRKKNVLFKYHFSEDYVKEHYDTFYRDVLEEKFNLFFIKYNWLISELEILNNFTYYQCIQPFYVLNFYLENMRKNKILFVVIIFVVSKKKNLNLNYIQILLKNI